MFLATFQVADMENKSSIYKVEGEVLAEMLFALRVVRRLSQAAVGKKLKPVRPQTYVSDLETKKRSISVVALLELLKVYNVPPMEFMAEYLKQLEGRKGKKSK